ncbi:cupin domain-containing protein [Methyloligella solikamskensis]|uniref:Cupin domain-containing protein n=1 Tax=Methyloligella solikamskensis TaxID=1177756 RepID=A0ABW3J9K6_9HYPH
MDTKAPAEGVHIGAKLRQYRLAQRLTLKEVAQKADCSESMLSKIENDKITPSIGLLHRLVSILGTNINALFVQMPTGAITRSGERPSIAQTGVDEDKAIALELLTPSPSPFLFQSSIHTVPPQAESDGKIVHQGEDFGYVLEGSLELSLGDETFVLNAGDTFYFRSEIPHGYRNPGKETARIIWFNTPATF